MDRWFYSRLYFGASAVLFGVLGLVWHDAETWQSISTLWRLPFGTALGEALMAAQAAGGIALLVPRFARVASIVLIAVYACFCLSCVPGIVSAPGKYEYYGSFFEQFCLFCGALAAFVLSGDTAKTHVITTASRIGLGVCAVSFTLAQVMYLTLTAQLVPSWIPPNQTFWAILTTVAFAAAAVAILLNFQALPAMYAMAAMTALFGLLIWIPAVVKQPSAHFSWSELALTVLISAATWLVAHAVSRVEAVENRALVV